MFYIYFFPESNYHIDKKGSFIESNNKSQVDVNTEHPIVHTRSIPFPEDLKRKTIHIMLALDKMKLYGLPAFINSVLKSTKTPVRIHILWCQDNAEMISQYLDCFDIPGFKSSDLDIVHDSADYMNDVFYDFLKIIGGTEKKFRSCSELVALQAHRVFPYLDKIIWLDTDMIIQGK